MNNYRYQININFAIVFEPMEKELLESEIINNLNRLYLLTKIKYIN